MIPVTFAEANARYGPPAGISESQVQTIYAYQGKVQGGSLDGETVVVTAWKPTLEELHQMASGQPVFLSFIGGLPPHMATTDFKTAVNPS